jgi:hypothetical protein
MARVRVTPARASSRSSADNLLALLGLCAVVAVVGLAVLLLMVALTVVVLGLAVWGGVVLTRYVRQRRTVAPSAPDDTVAPAADSAPVFTHSQVVGTFGPELRAVFTPGPTAPLVGTPRLP